MKRRFPPTREGWWFLLATLFVGAVAIDAGINLFFLTFGMMACLLAIPPVEARAIVWPVLVGILAAAFGVWTVMRGQRRLGFGAIAAGVIGIGPAEPFLRLRTAHGPAVEPPDECS